jgi:hypothetical protein
LRFVRTIVASFTVMSSSRVSPVGHQGRVTSSGAIRPGRLGEVMISIRGGVEAFMARDVDGGHIEPYEEIVVVEQIGPQTVLVTRLYDSAPDPGVTQTP